MTESSNTTHTYKYAHNIANVNRNRRAYTRVECMHECDDALHRAAGGAELDASGDDDCDAVDDVDADNVGLMTAAAFVDVIVLVAALSLNDDDDDDDEKEDDDDADDEHACDAADGADGVTEFDAGGVRGGDVAVTVGAGVFGEASSFDTDAVLCVLSAALTLADAARAVGDDDDDEDDDDDDDDDDGVVVGADDDVAACAVVDGNAVVLLMPD